MQQISFEISIDSSRTDAFVLVSSKLIKSFFAPYYGSNIPSVVPLKLSDGKRDMYVGCFTNKPHNNNSAESCNNKLFLSVVMGKDLGLEDGEIVHCVPVYKFTKAARVLVLPASVDESEVVEQNALRIEAQLLRQVQVIFPGMIISVAVFAGVHAKVVVQKIEDSQSREMTSGCAIMTEGTEFIVATRTRQICENNIDNNNTAVPMWSILRSQPHSAHEPTSTNLAEMEVSLVMNSATAERYHWKEGLRVGFWDLACMSQLLESKQLTPSFLRANAWQAPIRCSEEVPNGVCTCAALKQSFSNIVVFPNPDENVRHVTVKDIPDDSSLSVLSCKDVDYEQVASVHGDLPQEILNSLSNWFSQRRELRSPFDNNSVGVQGGNGNILLCGGRGYGKTTLVSAVLSKLRDVHVCLVQCTSEANRLLASLQEALVECVLCAPSVLILDNLDAIAPVQREGAVAAVSGTTKSILEGILRYFTDTLTFAGRSSVVVLATCKSREDVHERFRSANYFSKIVKLEPLNRKTRVILLKQMFPQETNDMVEKLASFMDNYTPFDVKKVSARIKSSCKDGVISSFDAMKDIIACFTPLSHTGITFLKGEKRSLDCIGGLSTAKKMLYDTLVLPIKHPELFSRLPLKTRSGILLYGPSGCGKTFLVETLVNATDLNCIVVNGPEVFGKYIGQSEEKIRDVFERAQAAAPCVIFFDEFDSVAPHRGVDNSGVTDRVVNQLLCYLDGVEGRKDVYVVAASSRPDLIDAALLRPGRLDKAVECPIPCYEERLEILTSCFKRVSANIAQDDIEAVARQTVNWSPADLSGLVSSANLFVSRRVIESLSLNNTEMNSEMNFAVANVGKGTTMEKIEDALKLLVGTAKPKQALDIVATRMDMEDVRRALEVTRPSLTPKDISEYNRVRSLFTGKDARDKPINVGNKLALQ